MGNFKPAEDFGGGYFDSNDIENHDGEQSFKTARGANSDLSRRRFAEYLGPGETHALIRAYRAGDQQAGDLLTRAYTRLVRTCAKGIHGPSHDDLIAAGMEGLTKAFHNFDLHRNNAFATYAKTTIRGHILDLARHWRQQGMGDDRASRYLFAHPNATAEEVARNCHVSIKTARASIARGTVFERYDALAFKRGYPEVFGGRYKLAPHLRDADVALAVRDDPAIEAQLRDIPLQNHGGNHARGAYFVDAACRAEELYALRRIKQIGRRAYALELVEHDLARIAARADPLLYLNDEGRAKYLARKKNRETKPHDCRSIRRRHYTPSRQYVFHADQRLGRPRPAVGGAKL